MGIKPKLRTFDLSMIVVSLVIGIGIFRTPTLVAQSAQTPFIFFMAWTLGGLVSICGALTFAEIGSRFPVPGGLYKIFSHCYHPTYAFMINWVLLLTYGAGAAGVTIIGVEYIMPIFLPQSTDDIIVVNGLVVGIVLVLGVLNFLGIKTGARIQNLLSVVKIIMIVGLCFAVFSPAATDPVIANDPVDFSFLQAMGISLIAVFYTYGGYQQTMNFGGDIQDPKRSIPRGIIIGISIIISLYLTLNYAYFNVLGFQGLVNAKLVAAELAGAIFGNYGTIFISIGIFISVLGFTNVTIMSNPRVYYAMAEDKVLPPIFKKVNEKTQTQEFALIFFITIIVLSVFLLGTFEKIVSYVMAIDSIALATACATVFVLRKRAGKSDSHDGYKVPFYPLLPIIFIVFLLMVTVNVFISDTVPALIGIGLFIAGWPLYYLLQKIYPKNN